MCLVPSSVKERERQEPWLLGIPVFMPEDGRQSSLRNIVILLKYRRLTKSKMPLLQIITHRRHKPSDLIDFLPL